MHAGSESWPGQVVLQAHAQEMLIISGSTVAGRVYYISSVK